MKLHTLAAVLALTLTMTNVGFAQSQATKIAPQNGWLNNLDNALALAQKNNKPLMIVFRCDP